MKKIGLVLWFLCVGKFSNAQSCDCLKTVSEIAASVEENYSGFEIKTSQEPDKYTLFKKSIYIKAKGKDLFPCYKLLKLYLRYFKDPHLDINFVSNKETQPIIKEIFSKERKILGWEKIIKKQEAGIIKNSIEGIWSNEDSSYVFCIYKKTPKKYIGIIKKADNIFWHPGQIKLEIDLNKRYDELIYYRRDHLPEKNGFYVSNNALYITKYGYWRKGAQVTNTTTEDGQNSYSKFYFRKISDSTCVLRLPNFSQRAGPIIDSIISKNSDIISHIPNLIIDIRDNPGGFNSSFASVLPFLYSGDYLQNTYTILASKGNIELYKNFARKNNLPRENGFYTLISDLEKNAGTVHTVITGGVRKPDTVYEFPRKVAILMNRGTVSAAEDLVLQVADSKKVVTMGEQTMGSLDFQNIIMARTIEACPYFIYNCPTGASPDSKKIDNIGIKPQISLKKKIDWILFATNYLEK